MNLGPRHIPHHPFHGVDRTAWPAVPRAPKTAMSLPIRVLIAALGLMFLLSAATLHAQSPPATESPSEYTIKAVFLYNFSRYATWSATPDPSSDKPFVIGVLGSDPFGEVLDEIAAKKTVHGRPIVIMRFTSLADYRDGCHILFVCGSLPSEQQAAAITRAEGIGTMLVGETPGFAEQGGTINFYTDGDRIRFEINAAAAHRARLELDGKLLSLGRPANDHRTTGYRSD